MRREEWWSQKIEVHVRKLWNIKIRSPHSQTAATWRMHEHAHSILHTYPKYTHLSCLYFLLLKSPWSRIILRICSGHVFFLGINKSKFSLLWKPLRLQLLPLLCCKINCHANWQWTLLLSTLAVPPLHSSLHYTRCCIWHNKNEKDKRWCDGDSHFLSDLHIQSMFR